MIRVSGRGALTKFRAGPMSGISLPLYMSAASSKVLSALDTRTDFRPDEDGVIDLTTPENDALSGAVGAQLLGHRPLSADS